MHSDAPEISDIFLVGQGVA